MSNNDQCSLTFIIITFEYYCCYYYLFVALMIDQLVFAIPWLFVFTIFVMDKSTL